WFRKDADGDFLWPGFGENGRVLEWIVDRIAGDAPSVDTPLGRTPARDTIDYKAAGLTDEQWAELFRIDPTALLTEADDTEVFLEQFGERLPDALRRQLAGLRERLAERAGTTRKAVA